MPEVAIVHPARRSASAVSAVAQDEKAIKISEARTTDNSLFMFIKHLNSQMIMGLMYNDNYF